MSIENIKNINAMCAACEKYMMAPPADKTNLGERILACLRTFFDRISYSYNNSTFSRKNFKFEYVTNKKLCTQLNNLLDNSELDRTNTPLDRINAIIVRFGKDSDHARYSEQLKNIQEKISSLRTSTPNPTVADDSAAPQTSKNISTDAPTTPENPVSEQESNEPEGSSLHSVQIQTKRGTIVSKTPETTPNYLRNCHRQRKGKKDKLRTEQFLNKLANDAKTRGLTVIYPHMCSQQRTTPENPVSKQDSSEPEESSQPLVPHRKTTSVVSNINFIFNKIAQIRSSVSNIGKRQDELLNAFRNSSFFVSSYQPIRRISTVGWMLCFKKYISVQCTQQELKQIKTAKRLMLKDRSHQTKQTSLDQPPSTPPQQKIKTQDETPPKNTNSPSISSNDGSDVESPQRKTPVGSPQRKTPSRGQKLHGLFPEDKRGTDNDKTRNMHSPK